MAVPVNKSKIVQKKVGNYGSKMGSRNLEIRPVGAWVQPAGLNGGAVVDAVEAAKHEEERSRQIEQQKAARLHDFQQNVKRRVQLLSLARKREQLQRSSRDLDLERHVMSQSSAPTEVTTPRKNHCTVRTAERLAISRPALQLSGLQSNQHQGMLNQHRDEVHRSVSHAKKKLMSKQVIFERYDDDKRYDDKEGCAENGHPDDEDCCKEDSSVESLPSSAAETLETDVDRVLVISHTDPPEDDPAIECRGPPLSDAFSTTSGVSLVSSVYPGERRQEEREREQNQRAMSRRLYMDLERQRVKENIQRQQHSIRVRELKKDVEAERRRIESLTEQLKDRRPPAEPGWERKLHEQLLTAERQRQSAQRRQRSVETSRYLEALKQNLRYKMEKKGVEIPALCNCGTTAWDTNPDTCANNCVFYKNPKAYTRALQCLLASCDVA